MIFSFPLSLECPADDPLAAGAGATVRAGCRVPSATVAGPAEHGDHGPAGGPVQDPPTAELQPGGLEH